MEPSLVEYDCDFCGSKYRTQMGFFEHWVIRHSANVQLIAVARESQHRRATKHKAKITVTCHDCQEPMDRSGLYLHWVKAHGPPRAKSSVSAVCDTCGFTATGYSDARVLATMRNHVKTAHLTVQRVSSFCDYCSRLFVSDNRPKPNSIFEHWVLSHSDNGQQIAALRWKRRQRPMPRPSNPVFNCEECGASVRRQEFWHHWVYAHRPELRNTPQPFHAACDICGYVSSTGSIPAASKTVLARHIYLCHYRLPTNRPLTHSILQKKNGCDDCGHLCRSKKDVLRHWLSNHASAGSQISLVSYKASAVSCDECSITCTRAQLWAHYWRIHSRKERAKPLDVLCDDCGRSFSGTSRKPITVLRHWLRFHGPTEEQERMKLKLAQQGLRQAMRRIKQPKDEYICEDCGKSFKTRGNLRGHAGIWGPHLKHLQAHISCDKCHEFTRQLGTNWRRKMSNHLRSCCPSIFQ